MVTAVQVAAYRQDGQCRDSGTMPLLLTLSARLLSEGTFILISDLLFQGAVAVSYCDVTLCPYYTQSRVCSPGVKRRLRNTRILYAFLMLRAFFDMYWMCFVSALLFFGKLPKTVCAEYPSNK